MKLSLPTLSSSIALAFSAVAAPAVAANAEAQANEDGTQERVDDDLHDRRLDATGEIIVSATGLKQLDVDRGEAHRGSAGQVARRFRHQLCPRCLSSSSARFPR